MRWAIGEGGLVEGNRSADAHGLPKNYLGLIHLNPIAFGEELDKSLPLVPLWILNMHLRVHICLRFYESTFRFKDGCLGDSFDAVIWQGEMKLFLAQEPLL